MDSAHRRWDIEAETLQVVAILVALKISRFMRQRKMMNGVEAILKTPKDKKPRRPAEKLMRRRKNFEEEDEEETDG